MDSFTLTLAFVVTVLGANASSLTAKYGGGGERVPASLVTYKTSDIFD